MRPSLAQRELAMLGAMLLTVRRLLALGLIVGCIVGCPGSPSPQERTFAATGELRTDFTAGTTGFQFVFFPDEGQPVAGMHMVETESAPELYRLTEARPDH